VTIPPFVPTIPPFVAMPLAALLRGAIVRCMNTHASALQPQFDTAVSGPRPKVTARAAGVLVLMTILGGIFAQAFVSNALISFADAAATANNILAKRSLFELSFTVYLIEMTCQIASAALFYLLLHPVSRNLALVAAFIELSGSIIKTMSRLFYITPLFVLSGTTALNAFSPEQLRAIALLLLKINDRGAAMAVMSRGAAALLAGLAADGRVDGAIAMGGGGGTAIAAAAMQALPVGFPKLIVSTLASGDTSAVVGVKDVTLMPAVVDIAGINRLSARILANAAGAIAGMVGAELPEAAAAKPLIAATMFGVTTPCVTLLHRAGDAEPVRIDHVRIFIDVTPVFAPS